MSENAGKLAGWLDGKKWVGGLRYPGLENSPGSEISRKYLKRGYGGLLYFTLKDGVEVDFMKSKLVSLERR